MSNNKTSGGFSALIASLTIAIALIVSICIYLFIMGNPANFVDRKPENHPLEGNLLGTVYKGGFIVPLLITVLLVVIIFVVERFVTLAKARGKGNVNGFVTRIKEMLEENDVQGAIEECDVQKGSLASVLRAGLEKYQAMTHDTSLTKEEKVEGIKKELEEATSLELPMLSKNLVILSTCASIGTLIGLIGTVSGMIKSFQAMSAGSPDTSQLSVGISEALINTFIGITASTVAIIFYNMFTTKIDQMTHSIDEAGFAVVQNFTATQK